MNFMTYKEKYQVLIKKRLRKKYSRIVIFVFKTLMTNFKINLITYKHLYLAPGSR